MTDGLQQRNLRGRPRLPNEKGKRYPLGIRTTKELKDLIQEAADSAGRSVAQEIEFRLEQSFEHPRFLAELREIVSQAKKEEQLEHEEAQRRVERAVSSVLGIDQLKADCPADFRDALHQIDQAFRAILRARAFFVDQLGLGAPPSGRIDP